MVEREIQKYYAERGGNVHGVPVQVIAIEMDTSSYFGTYRFVVESDLSLAAVDESLSAALQFFNGLAQPWVVVINGVENSPTHRQWEVIHSHSGIPTTPTLRGLVNSVEIELVPGEISNLRWTPSATRFVVHGAPGRRYRVEVSNDLRQWSLIATIIATESGVSVLDRRSAGQTRRYYRTVAF